jgi:hypothetical protein
MKIRKLEYLEYLEFLLEYLEEEIDKVNLDFCSEVYDILSEIESGETCVDEAYARILNEVSRKILH